MRDVAAVLWVALLAAGVSASDPFEITTPGVPGSGGVRPTLVGEGSATPNSANTLSLADAAPSAPAMLVFSMSELAVPYGGGVLGPAPDFVASLGMTDARGALERRFRMPVDAPAGLELWMQAWVTDAGGVAGLSASNTVKATVQAGPSAAVLFAGAQFAPTFDELQAMDLADLNGDGHLDLIAVNRTDFPTMGYVEILLGDGQRGFGEPTTYLTLGDDSNAVAIGDLDGDADLDLVVANRSTDDISVMLGKGDGTFATSQLLPDSGGPWDVELADLDGDGVLDMIVSEIVDDTISVRRGMGDGSFAPRVVLSAGDSPRGIAIADLDADSIPDVAVACEASDALAMFFGEGDGQLAPAQLIPTGDGPDDLAIGDLDGDGVLDLVVANRLADEIAVLLGVGDGSFAAPVPHAAGDGPIFIALRDLDEDGALDVAVANVTSWDVTVHLGTGAGDLAEPTTYIAGRNPRSLVLEDLDGDGIAELVVGNAANPIGFEGFAGEVVVFQGVGGGTFRTPTVLPLDGETSGVVGGDLNGDGAIDLLTTLDAGSLVQVRLGMGNGSFGAPLDLRLPVTFARAHTLADVNHDDALDLLLADPIAESVGVLLGDGAGSFSAPEWFPSGGAPFDIVIGDMDADGHSDLVCANTFSDEVTVLIGSGDGSFETPLKFPGGSVPLRLALADFDENGYPEIAIGPNYAPTVNLLFNIGQGELGKSVSFDFPPLANAVATGDLNADGHADLLITRLGDPDDSDHGNVTVLLGTGDGAFTSPSTYKTRVGSIQSYIADLDGDGALDIAVADGLFDLEILLGVGDGSFEPSVGFQAGESVRSLVIADLNGDVAPDIVCGGISDELWIQFNQLTELHD